MTTSALVSRQAGRSRWAVLFLPALIAALVVLGLAGTASAAAGSGAENRVGASNQNPAPLVGPSARIAAGQRLGEPGFRPEMVVATGVATNTADGFGSKVRDFVQSRLEMRNENGSLGLPGGDWPTPTEDNCLECAEQIQSQIGGDIAHVTPTEGQVLGPSVNNSAGTWFDHYVVLNEGRVFDGFTGPDGLTPDEFKAQFLYSDAIDFGF